MRLYVMRHGPAEDDAATGRDEDRALTERGRTRVRGVVQILVREAELPTRILASNLVRAQQTAEIVIAAGKARSPGWKALTETVTELVPGGRVADLVQSLFDARADAPMIVGHEPDLSSLVAELLDDALPLPMDKAMVVALDVVAAGQATLRFIVEPRSLTIVHDRRR
jgi:phosphohistidine phosphatase